MSPQKDDGSEQQMDLGTIFAGQSYVGHKNNLDIEEIQLEGFGEAAKFCIMTKAGHSTEQPAWIEGAIYKGRAVSINAVEGNGRSDTKQLKKQIQFAFNYILGHYINEDGSIKKGRKTDPSRITFCDSEDCVKRTYKTRNLADIVTETGVVKDHDDPDTKQTRIRDYVARDHHIRKGHIRVIQGKRHYFAPALIHPEKFTIDEKIDMGFDEDGTPTIEALERFKGDTVTAKEFRDYLVKNEHKYKTTMQLIVTYRKQEDHHKELLVS